MIMILMLTKCWEGVIVTLHSSTSLSWCVQWSTFLQTAAVSLGAFNERGFLQFEDYGSVPAADVLWEECGARGYTFYGVGGFSGNSPGRRTAFLDVMQHGLHLR